MSAGKTKAASLDVSTEAIVSLFVALGFKSAGKWDRVKLGKKIDNLPKLVEGIDTTDLPDEDSNLLDDILNAIQAGGDVTVEGAPGDGDDNGEDDEPTPAPKKTPAKAGKKAGKKAAKPEPEPEPEEEEEEEPEEEEEEEAEEEAEEDEPAPAPKKTPKPAPKMGEKPKPAPKKATIPVTVDRYGVSALVLTSGEVSTVEDAIEVANSTYIDGGGKDNEREAAFALRNTLRGLKSLGLVAQDGKNIKVVGKVVKLK